MEFLSKIIPLTLLVFVVSSMLAVGLSLTVKEILLPLRIEIIVRQRVESMKRRVIVTDTLDKIIIGVDTFGTNPRFRRGVRFRRAGRQSTDRQTAEQHEPDFPTAFYRGASG